MEFAFSISPFNTFITQPLRTEIMSIPQWLRDEGVERKKFFTLLKRTIRVKKGHSLSRETIHIPGVDIDADDAITGIGKFGILPVIAYKA
jgi:hypothetical protein